MNTDALSRLVSVRSQPMRRSVRRHLYTLMAPVAFASCLAVACGHSKSPGPEGVAPSYMPTPHDCRSRFPDRFRDWLESHPDYEGGSQPKMADSVEAPPMRLDSPGLMYPQYNLERGWHGWVLLDAVVEASGRVSYVEVLDARAWHRTESPTREQDEEARRAAREFIGPAVQLVKGSTYDPARDSGVKVSAVICLPIEFTVYTGR